MVELRRWRPSLYSRGFNFGLIVTRLQIYNTKDIRHPIVSLFLCFVFSIIPVTITYFIFSDFRIPKLPGIIGAIYVGLFEMSITYIVWLVALKCSENTAKVSSLIFLSPFISLILIHLLVGETIRDSTIGGLILIVFAIFIQKLKTRARDIEGIRK